MILLIDNYDSFSFNLVQLIGELVEGKEELKVIRNDELTVEEIMKLAPSHIVLSPGPGRPTDAGVCEALIRAVLEHPIPLLGVCLGHQAICEVYHATVTYASHLMHGKQSVVTLDLESRIFEGLEKEEKVARYHSLAAKKDTIPETLKITAISEDGEVMAVEHREYPVYGLQFHPESILTPEGRQMIANFLRIKEEK